jgi:hypothetical protein
MGMSIHDEHPASTLTDAWGMEPLMDVHEPAT